MRQPGEPYLRERVRKLMSPSRRPHGLRTGRGDLLSRGADRKAVRYARPRRRRRPVGLP